MFIKKGNHKNVAEVVFSNTGIPTDTFLEDIRDPCIKNLKEAVDFTKKHIKEHGKEGRITIVGDYDSDGINATAIMYWCFKRLGITPILRLPRRMSEGYGLNEKIIDEIPDGLLITVDNGIAALNAIQKAKDKGLSVIVMDHHLPVIDDKGNKHLPDADVVVDPNAEDESEYHDYCGAAVAYRFAKELLGITCPELLVLASIATVTDVMPLTNANRTLVKDGLSYINKRRVVPGLKALLDQTNLEDHINEGDYGFLIGPIFNASGRLVDNGAEKVVELLCLDNSKKYKATFIADSLVQTNAKRKEVVKEAMVKAEKLASGQRPIVIYDPSFMEGIVGILAGQLAEEYYCPVVVFTDSDKEGILKGSGRSISDINLKSVLDLIKDTMVGYGGHAGAAGLSIRKENLDKFREVFADACSPIPDMPKDIYYDLELSSRNMAAYLEDLRTFAPFGEKNPQIVFKARFNNLNEDYKVIGDGSHFMVRKPNITLMGFGLVQKFEDAGKPNAIECVGYLSESWFKGKSTVKFEIIDFEPLS